MAIGSKDFMSTQTGGEGETIQSRIEVPSPEQFTANIAPQTQQQQTTAPIVEQPNVTAEQPAPEAIEQQTQIQETPILSEQEKIYSDLGLIPIEIEIPEEVVKEEEVGVFNEPKDEPTIIEENLPEFTPDGIIVASASDLEIPKNQSAPIVDPQATIESDIAALDEPDVTPDGIPVFNFAKEEEEKRKTVETKYEGISVGPKGNVSVKKPATEEPKQEYPTYKLPNSDALYQKRGDKWFKNAGDGKFVPLTKGNVKQRSEYLDNNAVPVSELGTGTKNVQKTQAALNQRVGNLRNANNESIITAGGDPVVTEGLSFNALTRGNIGDKNERYNQDGTLNFNYQPNTANIPREAAAIIDYKGKDDGIYKYPDNNNSYKKENGKWYIKPKGSKEYMPIEKGNVAERIHNLETKAILVPKVKNAVSIAAAESKIYDPLTFDPTYKLVKEMNKDADVMVKDLTYRKAYDDASNFVEKDFNLLLGDNLSQQQKEGLMQYQTQLKEIMTGAEYDPIKAAQASKILREAEQYFNTAKDINKSINEAAQNGVSMARLQYDKKRLTAENMFLTGKETSEFSQEAFRMFEATSEMADFFIENTENGKLRFDSKSGQYVISKNISERERQYLDGKMGELLANYEQIQNERYGAVNNQISRYKKSLSDTRYNIKKIEQSLQGMRNSGVSVDDPKYAALASELNKQRKSENHLISSIDSAELTKAATFLTEPRKVAASAAGNMSQDAKNILSAIPSDIAPKEKFDLFYSKLYDETRKLMRDNNISEGRFSGMNRALKDLLDWDGFYALSDAEKKAAKNIATLRQLAPLYYNNDTGVTQDSAGFFESFMNSFMGTLFPVTSEAAGFTNKTEAVGKMVQTFAEEGISEEDFVDPEKLDKLNERLNVDFYSREKIGGMLGTTAGIIVPIMATAAVPASSLRIAKGVERLLTGVDKTSDAVGIISKAEKVYDAALSSNRVGRFLKPAIESGIKFETAGNIFGSAEEELYFLSGFAGGVASEALSGIISKLPKEQIYGYLNGIFGSQTNRLVNVMKRTGEASARGVAETGEEFAQEVTNIYRDTDSFKGMMAELSNRFGSFDQVQEFVISSFVMGAAFGIADGNQGKEVLAKMPEAERTQVNAALSEIRSALTDADEAVNEFVDNKEKQKEINQKIEEYDRQDQAGVSGEVAEGQELVEGQPVTEAGKEAPSPSGMVQKTRQEQAKEVETLSNTITDIAKKSPVRISENGKIEGGMIKLMVEAQKADAKPNISKPSNIPFLPETITLRHLARNANDLNSILKNGFDADKVSIDSPIPGVYLSSEDWSTMDRFGREGDNSLFVDIDNKDLLYFDTASDFGNFLRENNLPDGGVTLNKDQLNTLKNLGIKGILLREDYASQSRNELIVIDQSIIKNISRENKEITQLPSSFSDAKSISEAYVNAKANGSNPELVKVVDNFISSTSQEEQTGVEPVEERVTATSAEEAKALWDQGYRPSIEGMEIRGGKDMAIDNIFNTRQEVEMTRMVTPEPAAQPTATDPEAVVEPVEGAIPTEEKQITEKERFSEQLSLSEVDALRTAIRNKFPDSYTSEILDEVSKAIRTGESNLPFELDYLSDGITLNDVQGILAQDEVFESAREARNFLMDRAVSGELLKAKEEARTEGVKQRTYEKLADKIRSGKIDTRGMAMIGIVPPNILNAALEGVALTVETVGQVIEKIKESDWYKSLKDSSKPIIEREISRSLNNLASKPVYTQQDAESEVYITEFDDVYNNLLYEVENNPNAANVNNLKAFTDNPKQFVQDLIDTGEINSRAYEGINTRASREGKSVGDYMTDRIASVDSSISSDSKLNANNIIGKQYDKGKESDAPFIMSESLKITSDPEKAKADGYTDEEIKEAEEYLADPIKYHQEMYDLFGDKNNPYYDEQRAQKSLRQLNYVKSVYERYGVDTGLTPEQSQQIDQEAEQLPPTPAPKKKQGLTPEEKQARADARKAERERLKAEREAKKQADKEFGQRVAEATGTAKPQKTVQRTSSQALKDSIRDREKGWRMGQKNLQDIKEQVRNYAKENLPQDQYSKKEVNTIMNAITNARTPKGLEKALERVDNMVNKKAEAKRKRSVKEIQDKVSSKRTLFSKSGNKWVGKVSIDAQKEFLNFINSPALLNLENRTQQELDAINDIIDGILAEGKADYKAFKTADLRAKRERAAKLIEGLARGKEKLLSGIDAVRDWLDKGNVVIINGEMFRKSDLKSLEYKKAQAERKRKALEKKLEKLAVDPDPTEDVKADMLEASALDAEIRDLEAQLEEARATEEALNEASFDPNASFVGYQQEVTSEQKEASKAADRPLRKRLIKGLNPVNAINDIYSLLKTAYSGSSNVTKFIKENLERGIKKAYFERMKGYQQKVADYYSNLEQIFGSKNAAINTLSKQSEVNPSLSVLSSKDNLPPTNGHMVDWYNLIKTNENGAKRMEAGNKNPDAIVQYVESNPQLKAYADYLLKEYNDVLRSEYEPVYESYTNTPFGDTTYYPAYAAGFEESFVSEDQVMGEGGQFNMMSATSRNLKQRTNYSGPFDTRLDAHAKFLDYVKTMEHAKHFMPIAKSANELFSKINSAYLVESMGAQNYNDLKEHLAVILGDTPIKGGGGFDNFLSGFRSLSVVATLGFKLSAIPKQFSSFTHFWTAGIELGVDPWQVMTAAPMNRDELKFSAFIITSPYVKERYQGGSIDLEVRALADKAMKTNAEQYWESLSKGFLWPVRFGDRSSISTGGGQFALAVYRKALNDGMSPEQAKDYAYEQFVTQSEASQQSTRNDFTSLIQRDPVFRTTAMYRTGQMANMKKVVNGLKTIRQAYEIQKNEGINEPGSVDVETRREAISDREIIQAIVDVAYYSTVGSWLFNAVAGGALYYMWATDTDDDERKRMVYDLAMNQVSSNLQGMGAPGFFGDYMFNYMRGNDWMNENIPVFRFMQGLTSVPAQVTEAMIRDWPSMTVEQRRQWLIDNEMSLQFKGFGSRVDFENFKEDFVNYSFYGKMTDAEKDKLIKSIGAGNINKLITDFGKYMDGESDLFKTLMGYEESYAQKDKEKGKRDLIFELMFDEPYVKREPKGGIRKDLIFPEVRKQNQINIDLLQKLK